ncbi:MAG: hypothetical protein H7Y30_10695, partial [Pyrinomonadaceae bacterium]|nr:hypothetical protein [Pyrinomonadaceae bacterium]
MLVRKFVRVVVAGHEEKLLYRQYDYVTPRVRQAHLVQVPDEIRVAVKRLFSLLGGEDTALGSQRVYQFAGGGHTWTAGYEVFTKSLNREKLLGTVEIT